MDFLREFAIGINFVEITLDIIIALYIFRGYLREQLEAAGYAVAGFLFLAAMRISYIIYDYYAAVSLYLYLAWIFLCAGIVFIIVSLFKGVLRSIIKDFPYKIPYFVGLGVYIAVLAIIRPMGDIFYIACVGIGILLLIPLIFQFNELLEKTGHFIKRYFTSPIIGLPLAFLAIGLGPVWSDIPVLKIVAHCLFLASLILLTVALLRLPSLGEFEWEKTLGKLYIILSNGAVIYSFNFKEVRSIDPERLIDPQLLGSGLTGIVAMVQEMTKSKKKLIFIKQEWKNLYVEYGKSVTVALMAEEELEIIFEKLEEFVDEFERIFPDVVKWEYTTGEFKIVTMLVRSIFAI